MYVVVGALLLITIVYMPDRGRLVLGRILPPNWMSLIHVPIAWFGYFWLYKQEHYFAALILLCLSGGLDLADGRVARAYDRLVGKPPKNLTFWTQMNHRGETSMGQSLDPACDKITVGPIFLDVCWTFCKKSAAIRNDGILWLLYLGVSLIILMLLVDISGQLLRLDYFKRWRRRKKHKRATKVGKYKTLAQWAWLALYPIWEQGWLPEAATYYLCFLDVALVATLILAMLSVLSKMRPLKVVWAQISI
ncbi:CDP-alcohol phosphatidyltransferase family protein [Candidatus Peregrinibacteria bacterium]|nr:CDP-alcohol phosphatidyltransferase family protein [Candidatus Peregrinibacteria bacterium]